MTGYHADVSAIRNFAQLMSMSGDIPRFVHKKIEDIREMEGQYSGNIFRELVEINKLACARAEERCRVAGSAIHASAAGVNQAAKFYEETDDSAEAEIDAAYPKVSGGASGGYDMRKAAPEAGIPDSESVFTYVPVSEQLHASPDYDDLKVQLITIETFGDWLSDKISPLYWVNKFISWLAGGDILKICVEYSTGSWEAWGEAAGTWRNAGKTYQGLADENLSTYTALPPYWRGNAADAAIAYFAKLTDAVEAEVPFYEEFLVPICKQATELVYMGFESIKFLISFVFDFVATLGISAIARSVAKSLKVVNTVEKILKTWEKLGDALNALKMASLADKSEEAAGNAGDGFLQPPCPLEKLQLVDHPYTHPSEAGD